MLLLLTITDMVEQGKMKLETIYRTIIISTLCFMVIVVISPFIGIDLGSFYGIGDVRGPYGSHSLALCLSLGFIVTLALCPKQRSRFFQLILLLLCVASAISIARTYARTGYLSFFTSLLVFTLLVWHYGKRETTLRRYRVFLNFIFIIIIGTFCVYSLTHAEDLKRRTTDLSTVETAGSGRTIIYRKALEKYSDSSVFKQAFGSGLGDMYFLLGRELKVPHNDYLVFLLAGGLVGLILHLELLISLWRQIKHTARVTYQPLIIAGSAMAMFIVGTMTNPMIGYMSVMTYFSFIVGGAMGHYARMEQIDAN
jgi:O-antigen ligase